MMKAKLIRDTIIVENKGSIYLYSIMDKKAAKMPAHHLQRHFAGLKDIGFFNKMITEEELYDRVGSLFLLITRDCPLACRYCYAYGGINKERMSIETADATVEAYLKLNPRKPNVRFGGGGEPTLVEEMIRYIVEKYEKDINSWTMITSGVMDEKLLRWLVEKHFHITFSLDGPPEIQDFNRPMRSGSASSVIVERNIKIYKSLTNQLSIRCTITKNSALNFPKVLQYFKDLGVTRVNMEPMYPMGRGRDRSEMVPSPSETLRALIQALEWGRQNNVFIRTTTLFGLSPSREIGYCGPILGTAIVVNHQGYLVACGEALEPSHPFWDIFHIGRLDVQNKRFEIDHNKRRKLAEINIENINPCKNCFAKYICRGGCPIGRLHTTGSLYKPNPYHCFLVRNIVKAAVVRAVEGRWFL